MVDSVDELESSRSMGSKDFPNFEMLDARIASALNKIIQKSSFFNKPMMNRVSSMSQRNLALSTKQDKKSHRDSFTRPETSKDSATPTRATAETEPAVLRDSTGSLAEAEEQEWRQEETERSYFKKKVSLEEQKAQKEN